MEEQIQEEKNLMNEGAILVPGAGYMGLIFEYLTFEENIKIIQQLFKKAYYEHVPSIFKTVYLVPFTRVPKMQPKHEFINMVRTMNT